MTRLNLNMVLLGLAAAGLVAHALQYPFITDDAYISFRYAYNLAHGNGLVFNPGERVEGFSNFLWTVLLGGLLRLGLRPDVTSRVLGAAFGVGVLFLLHVFSRLCRGGRPTGWSCLGPFLLAASGTFAVWASGGLETQMFTALALGGMTLYLAEHGGRVRWRLSGLVLALAAMTRPEGLLLFGLTGLHRLLANLLGERRVLPSRAELCWLAGFLLPFGSFFLWRYGYYGYPLPNTYYVKAGGGAAASITAWGLPYLTDFARDNLPLMVCLPLPLLFWPRSTWRPPASEEAAQGPGAKGRALAPAPGLRPAFVWSYVLLVIVTYSAYVVYVGGDFMAMGRFFHPLMPLLAFVAQEGLREAAERVGRRAPDEWRPARAVPLALLFVGLQVSGAVWLKRQAFKDSYYRWGLDSIAYLKKFADDRILIGTWMRHRLPRDTYLAVGGAGAIVYASRLRALDTFGLNDEWIAHSMPRLGDRPGHTKFAPEDYILSKRPDLMCHQAKTPDWGPFRPRQDHELNEAEMWRRRGYEWVCIEPSDLPPDRFPPEIEPGYRLRPSYYCCLKRLDRALGPFPAR